MLAQLQIENRVEGGKFKGGIQKHLSSPSYAPQLARLTIKIIKEHSWRIISWKFSTPPRTGVPELRVR